MTTLRAADVTSEADFQATVIEMAHALGWRVYHTYRSTRSTPGFPDLVLVRGDRLLFLELKSEKGKLTTTQMDWLHDLYAVSKTNLGIHAAYFRPSDMPTIRELLT